MTDEHNTAATGKTMGCELFFPTPIFHTDLPDQKAINAHVKPLIYQWREREPHGELRTNEPRSGGWHSNTRMHLDRDFDPLTREIFEFVHGVFAAQGYDAEFEPACDSMWANINPRHASNRHHTHPRALWSGVYWVQAPEDCGLLYFSDPRAQTQILPPYYDLARRPANTWHEVHYQPVEGRLLLFPAWLPHAVQPNMNAQRDAHGDRISVSFNFHQRRERSGDADVVDPVIVRADLER